MRSQAEIEKMLKHIKESDKFTPSAKLFAEYLIFWILGVNFNEG